jgi:hypothetical protein
MVDILSKSTSQKSHENWERMPEMSVTYKVMNSVTTYGAIVKQERWSSSTINEIGKLRHGTLN